jgi:UDP-N-acetylmuramoyl-L-alanyl-D-glutamate--2,6-diaminopimelate ligase
MASTILFKVGERETLNDKKMTMVGRFQLQSLLREMVAAGCTHAIVETTSEGIKQFRHLGIHYDVCVFTNLYPEHIESHGSFEAYKAAKLKLFEKLARDSYKVVNGKRIKKGIVINAESEYSLEFTRFDVDEVSVVFPSKRRLSLSMLGEHNQANAHLALAVGEMLGYDAEKFEEAISRVSCVPGRLEIIDEGQDFTVIVDYAFEPVALEKLYDTVKNIPHRRVIHVTSSTGGGRDVSRRSKIGAFVAARADVMIVTNEDPYDEKPEKIIDEVADVAVSNPRVDVQKILDRGEAIRMAIAEARTGDIVLITGKGSEQAIAVERGKLLKWDDRECARLAIRNLKK